MKHGVVLRQCITMEHVVVLAGLGRGDRVGVYARAYLAPAAIAEGFVTGHTPFIRQAVFALGAILYMCMYMYMCIWGPGT